MRRTLSWYVAPIRTLPETPRPESRRAAKKPSSPWHLASIARDSHESSLAFCAENSCGVRMPRSTNAANRSNCDATSIDCVCVFGCAEYRMLKTAIANYKAGKKPTN